jgi:hypothetical protein
VVARHIVGATEDERRELARAGLAVAEAKPSYVRSFAYGSAAYGTLLDQSGAIWRRRALAGADLGDLLAHAFGLTRPTPAAVRRREAAYDGDALRREETERSAARDRRVAAFRAHLVDGPTLTLPAQNLHVNFNPNELEHCGRPASICELPVSRAQRLGVDRPVVFLGIVDGGDCYFHVVFGCDDGSYSDLWVGEASR